MKDKEKGNREKSAEIRQTGKREDESKIYEGRERRDTKIEMERYVK